jgi:hypothetical protein
VELEDGTFQKRLWRVNEAWGLRTRSGGVISGGGVDDTDGGGCQLILMTAAVSAN